MEVHFAHLHSVFNKRVMFFRLEFPFAGHYKLYQRFPYLRFIVSNLKNYFSVSSTCHAMTRRNY